MVQKTGAKEVFSFIVDVRPEELEKLVQFIAHIMGRQEMAGVLTRSEGNNMNDDNDKIPLLSEPSLAKICDFAKEKKFTVFTPSELKKYLAGNNVEIGVDDKTFAGYLELYNGVLNDLFQELYPDSGRIRFVVLGGSGEGTTWSFAKLRTGTLPDVDDNRVATEVHTNEASLGSDELLVSQQRGLTSANGGGQGEATEAVDQPTDKIFLNFVRDYIESRLQGPEGGTLPNCAKYSKFCDELKIICFKEMPINQEAIEALLDELVGRGEIFSFNHPEHGRLLTRVGKIAERYPSGETVDKDMSNHETPAEQFVKSVVGYLAPLGEEGSRRDELIHYLRGLGDRDYVNQLITTLLVNKGIIFPYRHGGKSWVTTNREYAKAKKDEKNKPAALGRQEQVEKGLSDSEVATAVSILNVLLGSNTHIQKMLSAQEFWNAINGGEGAFTGEMHRHYNSVLRGLTRVGILVSDQRRNSGTGAMSRSASHSRLKFGLSSQKLKETLRGLLKSSNNDLGSLVRYTREQFSVE